MKLIRKNVFETNSSSTHSITIANSTGLYSTLPVDENGVVNIISGDFGWEEQEYSDTQTKAAYIAVYIRDWSGDKQDEFRNIFENLLKEVTGCDSVEYEDKFWDSEERSYKNSKGEIESYTQKTGDGYIDHQSVEDNDYHFLFEESSSFLKPLNHLSLYDVTFDQKIDL